MWEPLIDLVGSDLAGWFMWMFALDLSDGTRVYGYKHVATRAYLHVAVDGRTFYYDWDGETIADGPVDYAELPRAAAITAVFNGWLGLQPQPEDAHATWRAIDRVVAAAERRADPGGASNALQNGE